jgi:hypothetical protein
MQQAAKALHQKPCETEELAKQAVARWLKATRTNGWKPAFGLEQEFPSMIYAPPRHSAERAVRLRMSRGQGDHDTRFRPLSDATRYASAIVG